MMLLYVVEREDKVVAGRTRLVGYESDGMCHQTYFDRSAAEKVARRLNQDEINSGAFFKNFSYRARIAPRGAVCVLSDGRLICAE